MRAYLVVFGLLVGCAKGAEPAAEGKPAVLSRYAGTDASEPVEQDLGIDPNCGAVAPGPICEDYHLHNPWPWPLVQYSVDCDAGFITWHNCTLWSYNPNYYSSDTWAYCCHPYDGGVPR